MTRMTRPIRSTIAFFGSSLLSAYWNGAATYYRGIIRALHRRGHDVHFFEPDAFDRQRHRDIEPPPWAKVSVYPATVDGVMRAVEQARGSDLVIKASGVGVFDELLERVVLELRSSTTMVGFWDVDAPATLDRVTASWCDPASPQDPFAALIPTYDVVFTYGGGPRVQQRYLELGARACALIYNGFDPETHHRVPPDRRFDAVLGFLGNRLPDREQRVEEFLVRAAVQLPEQRFLLGGAGWETKPLPANLEHVGHVFTRDHNAFNSTPLAVLNINRTSMVNYGYSPATRVFEAASAGACLITDAWEGIDRFLEPSVEILVAESGDEVVEHLRRLGRAEAAAIGERARQRMLGEHTYAHRALDVEAAIGELPTRSRSKLGSGSGSHTHARSSTTLNVVVLGLSITSSWGNGHATTYRALLRELARRGHSITFLERDRPWYATHRDLARPDYCDVHLYRSLEQLRDEHQSRIAEADFVLLGSYVPDGRSIAAWVLDTARGATGFYDIDTPVTLARLANGRCDYLDARNIPRFDLYLSFTGGPTLARLMRDYGSPRAVPLYCSVDPDGYRAHEPSGPDSEFSWDLSYMGTYSDDRQATLDHLLLEPARRSASLRGCVAGPLYPESIAWPANVARIEHLAPADHASFYGASRFTLNVTRRAMIDAGYSPSVRLFEAAACGTPILTDVWPGLDTFFAPNAEILPVRSTDEVLAILRAMPESARRQVGARARQRVLREHTAGHRAETLERYIFEVAGVSTLTLRPTPTHVEKAIPALTRLREGVSP